MQLVRNIVGTELARGLGKKLAVRASETQFNMKVVEIFYDNWMEVGDRFQTKVGRLSILIAEDGDYEFDNNFNYYVPI